MKRLFVFLVTGLLLTLTSLPAEAGRARIHVQVTLGGAVVLGGAALFWSISYAAQSSRKEDPSREEAHFVSLPEETLEEKAPFNQDPLIPARLAAFGSSLIEFPILVFRW